MGLFDKKYCDICGEKIGLFGNRKLSDGNLCKDCAQKLSPWFSERRQSGVEDIRAQLAYREENKAAVSAFHTTLTYGSLVKILLDEDARKFMVTSERDLVKANPDVLDYSQITGCEVQIEDDRYEITQDGPDGAEISYNPPQYGYSYDIYMLIHVNHPYFDEIRFKLNSSEIRVEPVFQIAQRPMGAPPVRPGVPVRPSAPASARPAPAAPSARPAPAPIPVVGSRPADPNSDADYVRFVQMGEDIRSALMGVRQEAREAARSAAAPAAAVVCPFCGATTTPDASGCCEYCGGALRN